MTSKTYSATLQGLDPIKIEVEVTALAGTPNLVVIGLPNKAIEEARERITACFAVLKIPLKHRRTIVNLAPADVKKTRSSLELAILAALLQLYNVLRLPPRSMLFGELSLAGDIKPISGLLPLVLAAQKMGARHVFIPAANASQVPALPKLKIHPLAHVSELLSPSNQGSWPEQKFSETVRAKPLNTTPSPANPFSSIVGHNSAKRALTIAAAGKHHILLIGPPGTGKTKLARAVPTLLPQLSETQSLEVTSIYSLHQPTTSLVTASPFRAPHHSISLAGMLGGGSNFLPGELALAHQGILFLDELAEFPRNILESLRQPLEEKNLRLARAHGSTTYPCNFLLVAATNPCPCGFYGSPKRSCSCSISQRQSYWQKFSGPLWDRFDLQIWLEAVPSQELFYQSMAQPEPNTLTSQLNTALEIQHQRYHGYERKNGDYQPDILHQLIPTLNPQAHQVLTQASTKLSLSSRASLKVLTVSRTIADLDNSERIQEHHVQEALGYRLNQEMLQQ